MANQGPVKLTPAEVAKFNAILKLPAGAEKTRLHQALSATEKEHLKIYIEVVKAKQSIKQSEQEVKVAQERKQAAEARAAEAKLQQAALESRLEVAQAKLEALQLQEAALVAKDKAIVVKGSRGFAKELDSVKKQPALPTANKQVGVVDTGPKY